MITTRTSIASALLGIFALAACGNEPTTSAAPQAGSQPSAAATGTAVDPSQNPFWLNTAGCSTGDKRFVHYSLGGQEIAFPQQIVRRLVLLNQAPTDNIDESKPLSVQVPDGTGCVDNPLAIGGVVTRSRLDNELLEGTVTLFGNPNQLVRDYGELITDLQTRRPKTACQDPQGDLLLCFGKENLRGNSTDVLYIITTSASEKLNFGAPLFTRCEIQDNKPVGCNLGDLASRAIFVDATLSRLPRNTAELRAAHDVLLGQFGARQNAAGS